MEVTAAGRRICTIGCWGETLAKQAENSVLQLGDDQWRFLSSRIRFISSGSGDGWVDNCEKRGRGKLRDMASAVVLAMPGMCSAEMAMLEWAVKKNRQRRRRLTGWYFARPELIADTMAMLSQ